jgi:hypothetical protein
VAGSSSARDLVSPLEQLAPSVPASISGATEPGHPEHATKWLLRAVRSCVDTRCSVRPMFVAPYGVVSSSLTVSGVTASTFIEHPHPVPDRPSNDQAVARSDKGKPRRAPPKQRTMRNLTTPEQPDEPASSDHRAFQRSGAGFIWTVFGPVFRISQGYLIGEGAATPPHAATHN